VRKFPPHSVLFNKLGDRLLGLHERRTLFARLPFIRFLFSFKLMALIISGLPVDVALLFLSTPTLGFFCRIPLCRFWCVIAGMGRLHGGTSGDGSGPWSDHQFFARADGYGLLIQWFRGVTNLGTGLGLCLLYTASNTNKSLSSLLKNKLSRHQVVLALIDTAPLF